MNGMRWMCLLATAGLVGCGQPGDKTAILEETVREQATQLAKLQRTQEKMREELDSLRATPSATVQLPTEIATNIDALVTAQVEARVEKKLGSKSEVDTFMRGAVDQAMAAYDARKKAEQEARREEERQQAEQRRKQWEEQRWTQTASELGLNEQQKVTMRAASEAVRSKIEEQINKVREEGKLDPENAKQVATQLKAEYESELARILTPEQIETYKQGHMNTLRFLSMVAENGTVDFHRGFNRGGGNDRGGGNGGQPAPGGNR